MTPIPLSPAAVPPIHARHAAAAGDPLYDAAVRLEATFLAEMLKSAGLGKGDGGFDGGIGEEQFTSFLTDLRAQALAEAGGIGLAESLFHAMKVQGHG